MSIHNIIAGRGNILSGNSYVGVHDNAPYLFRKTGGDKDIGNALAEYDTLVGASAVVNQLVRNGNFDGTTNWGTGDATLTVANGIGKMTATSRYGRIYTLAMPFIKDHVYLVSIDIKGTTALTALQFDVYLSGVGLYPFSGMTIGTSFAKKQSIFVFDKTSSNRQLTFQDNRESGWDEVQLTNVNIVDLTAYFGASAIPNRAYTLESGTAGAGVAWLKSYNFDLFRYHDFNAGTLQSTQASKHKMVGFNQWDEEWELGSINASTGQNESATTQIRSKNYIHVIPSTTYYCYCGKLQPLGSGYTIPFYCYDADKQYIGRPSPTSVNNATFTVPSNCHYIRFRTGSEYGGTYLNDICINRSNPSRDGEYEQYKKWEYDLPNTELYGRYVLDQNNNIYADGDVLVSSGGANKKYRIVTYDGSSDEGWGKESAGWQTQGLNTFYIYIRPYTGRYLSDNIQPIISDSYIATSYYGLKAGRDDKVIGFTEAGASIDIIENSCTSVAEFKTKLASNPITVIYEIATPRTEITDPFQSPQVVDPYGSEEYVDGRTVELPVGHETDYYRKVITVNSNNNNEALSQAVI